MSGVEEPLQNLSINNDSNIENSIKLVPCSFQFYSFSESFHDCICHYHVIQMSNSLFIYIGNNKEMTNIALSMLTMHSKAPVSTVLFGETTDNISLGIANRLSKRLSKQVFVSYNLGQNKILIASIEKRLLEEINKHPTKF
ncbi:proteasome assembly chaperone 4-like [Ctenocephalides felis]|uniref:proteasome assembly chaperone 4-like n=1 Tax=Ctenocephalides felis TaxID=7515 RepID=UPI000E6E4B7B|nr:proteasome assembly chaperone 4-like [Ctenocephalides felis]XP_026468168.1 proteasome assembly chaperone 4-like [Ctenocephalides felis]